MAEVTYSQAFQQGMREEMDRNDHVFVVGTDIYDRGGHFAQLKGLGERFGHDRVRDAPISEAAMVAAGVGAALNGCHPVVDLNFMDFAYGAMDEIINQAAKIRYMWGAPVPLVIRATAGVAGGGAQHNNSLQAWFASTPGLTVVFPSRPYDVKGLIKSALRIDDPVVFMMHKRLSGVRGEVGGPDELVPIGAARTVRPGSAVTVVTHGHGRPGLERRREARGRRRRVRGDRSAHAAPAGRGGRHRLRAAHRAGGGPGRGAPSRLAGR